jgi:uracil-DNA glycosylase family 4
VALVSPEPENKAPEALAALAERISSCAACPRLVAWRNQAAAKAPKSFSEQSYWARPLPGFGDPAARLVIVGLAPAAHGGNRTGRMFTGDRSGDFLVAGLHRHGFSNQATSVSREDGLCLTDAYLTAPVRCAPPENKPLPAERASCLPYLEEELGLLSRAEVLLALGAYAFDSIGRLPRIKGRLSGRFAHGSEHPLSPGAGPQMVLCSYHPSQRNVFTGLLTAEMFSDVLARARRLLS